MKINNRIQLIQFLIDNYGLHKYLEIGVRNFRTLDKIICLSKVGIDPILEVVRPDGLRLSSDEFFRLNTNKFDIVFVDGLHLYEQVIRDIVNSYNCLAVGGFIIVHDCLPSTKEMCSRNRTTIGWTGDVWKAIIWFRTVYPKILCYVLNLEYGCGIIVKNNDDVIEFPVETVEYDGLDFDWFQKNRHIMNIVEEVIYDEYS